MRFKKIKKRFLQKKYQTLLKHPLRRKSPVHKHITTVGILALDSISSNVDLQQHVTDTFGVRNPKIYSFRNFSKDHTASYKHFSEEDFDWKGNITDSSLQAFLDADFDMLITFFERDHLYLAYATLSSKASLKVGYANVNSQLFDLEIQVDHADISTYLLEVKKYLTILDRLQDS